MSDAEIARQLERLVSDNERREKAAAQRHEALVKAVTAGFAALVKEIHESLTRIEHTMIDNARGRH